MRRELLQPGVLALDFDRPQRGNALSAELVGELTLAVDEAAADAAVHTLVLRPAGKHFCTGFDLGELDNESDADLLQRFVRVELLLASLWHSPLRTVALAQGRAWGAGADLFAACDVRAAMEGTTFCFPGAGFGLVLGTRRLAERVGADLARRWTTEALVFESPEALRAGFATDIVAGDPDQWLSGRCAPPAVDRQTAGALRAATRPDLRDADLAALVRSAAPAGLRQRIRDYRERQLRSTPGRDARRAA
jgi:enoyl-CoA hydratase